MKSESGQTPKASLVKESAKPYSEEAQRATSALIDFARQIQQPGALGESWSSVLRQVEERQPYFRSDLAISYDTGGDKWLKAEFLLETLPYYSGLKGGIIPQIVKILDFQIDSAPSDDSTQ